MSDVSAFFGSGYKEPTEPIEPNIIVNVMGKKYNGKDMIEISYGKIIIDGVSKGEAPNTSGVWFKVLKGKIAFNEKKTLTIIS